MVGLACVCVCVRARARARMCACVCVCVFVCVEPWVVVWCSLCWVPLSMSVSISNTFSIYLGSSPHTHTHTRARSLSTLEALPVLSRSYSERNIKTLRAITSVLTPFRLSPAYFTRATLCSTALHSMPHYPTTNSPNLC